MNLKVAENKFYDAVDEFNKTVLEVLDTIVAAQGSLDQKVDDSLCIGAKQAVVDSYTTYINRGDYMRTKLKQSFDGCDQAYAEVYNLDNKRLQGDVFVAFNKVKADYEFSLSNLAIVIRNLRAEKNNLSYSIEPGDEE